MPGMCKKLYSTILGLSYLINVLVLGVFTVEK